MLIRGEGDFENIFKNHIINRPWGLFNTFADNEQCTVKILKVLPGQSLSMQVHQYRDQFYYLFDNDFIVEYSTRPIDFILLNNPNALVQWLTEYMIHHEAKEGEMFGFRRGVIHRLSYNGFRDFGRCLDIAFGWNDEEDIIRIKDNYGRK